MAFLNRVGPLYDQVYEVLWARILSGEIGHGTRLSDLEWSAKLNVSRTPVREAMRKLQQDGVLLPLTRGGYEVRRMQAQDLQSLYRCRAVLEALAVREAAPNISPRQIEKLTKLVQQTKSALESRDFEKAFKLNTQFHEALVSFSGNPYLENLLKGLRRMILFARSSLMVAAHDPKLAHEYAEHLSHTQRDHQQILDFLQKGNAQAAANQMQEHLFSTGDDMSDIALHMGG